MAASTPTSSEPGSGSSTTVTLEQRVVKVLKAKQLWLDWAEIFDAWRIVPRSILYSFAAWGIWVIDRVLSWYFHLPDGSRTGQDAALVGSVITSVTGLFTLALGFYNKSGRQWSGQPPP